MFFEYVLLSIGVTLIVSLVLKSYMPIIFAAFMLYLLLNLRERHEEPK
jgi:hypothetical protein